MYKWNPEEYENNSANQEKWGRDLVMGLNLNGDERVLDIGCGVGQITFMIAEKLPHGSAVGIDSSFDMIRQAKKNYPVNKYPNLSFKLKDAGELDYIDEFDVVFSNACLHWVKNHVPVLQHIKNSLRHKGRTMLQMGGRDNAKDILEIIDLLTRKPEWKKFFNNFVFPYGFYGPEEYHSWLTETGLIIKRLELIPKDMIHDNKEKFAAWIRTTWLPYTQAVPDSLRERFIDELVLTYIRFHPAEEDGLIHIKMNRLEVEAQKL